MFTVGNLLSSFNNVGVDTIITIKNNKGYIFRGFAEDIPEGFTYYHVMFFEMISENEIELEVF